MRESRSSQRPMVNVIVTSRNEAAEKRVRGVGLAEEFRMVLAGHEKWVILQLDHFDQLPIRRRSAENETGFLELLAVSVVEFVTMPMPLVNHERAVELGGSRADDQLARL